MIRLRLGDSRISTEGCFNRTQNPSKCVFTCTPRYNQHAAVVGRYQIYQDLLRRRRGPDQERKGNEWSIRIRMPSICLWLADFANLVAVPSGGQSLAEPRACQRFATSWDNHGIWSVSRHGVSLGRKWHFDILLEGASFSSLGG